MTLRAPIHLFDRQKRLLALLHALGGRIGSLDFQKLLFLFCEEHAGVAPYEFIPYKFGAFSFSSYADRRKLAQRGLIEENDREWLLTSDGEVAAKGLEIDMKPFAEFASRHDGIRGDALVAETYRRFPYYAIRSEIADRILRGDKEALRRVDEARPLAGGSQLSTIGYEGRSLEGYLNDLIRAGVNVLCDVRRNAISRKYGFSKSTLQRGCVGVGIRYEHVPELGIASEDRRGLSDDAAFRALFAEYRRETLRRQGPALERIREWLRNGDRVALTCYERKAQSCHRHCVADALLNADGRRYECSHL